MTALRSDSEPDGLNGYDLDAAKEEVARMTRRAEEIAAHLNKWHYCEGSYVGRNLRAELEACEREAFDLLTRIAEYEGAPDVRGCGRCGCRNVRAANLTACRLCGHDLRTDEEFNADMIAALGACVACGVRPRTSVEGYCEMCDPPLPRPEPMLTDYDKPFLPDDEDGA